MATASSSSAPADASSGYTKLPFPPVTKQHILNCSFHSWHPRYRGITPKARLVPLSPPFLSYLRADGIVLPPDEDDRTDWSDSDSGIFSSTDNASETDGVEEDDPSTQWREVHEAVRATIEELGGKVVPKLNWSAPKDATWIAATNSMECRTPNDIYLLLKSSDFVTHDLEHAFDDCEDEIPTEQSTTPKEPPLSIDTISYHLVLRKHITINPSVEFRCFVQRRKLIAICQRDLNYFEFLFKMRDKLRDRIEEFFQVRLQESFPDENFTFDIYVPPPHDRVWLIDINPWAQRTDPLLFSWLELLTLPEPAETRAPEAVTLPLRLSSKEGQNTSTIEPTTQGAEDSNSEDEDDVEDAFAPEFRLVHRDDPEAYGFTTPQYSAHKLPRDVVDASRGGEGSMREFANQWKEVLAKQQTQDGGQDSEDD